MIARARETRPDGHRPPTQWATLGGRTAYLLAKFWRDDRPKMADQCSTKSSVIRDIIRGKAVTPAERDQFLHGASQHHAINGQWLRTGEGTPFRTGFAAVLAPALESAGGPPTVPVTASPPQAAPVQATPPRERIVGVCATLWGGDRYRAQAATGIPTAIWHNLLHGHQEPTDDHLLALATLDGSPFRPEWVIDGTGSPWRDFAPPEPDPEPQPAPTPAVPPDDPHAERIERAERRITDLAQKLADLIAAGRNAEHTTDARLSGLARELGILRDHTAGIERTIGQDRQELQSLSEAVTVTITRHDRLEARMKDYPHPHQIQDTGENISALRILMEEAFQRIDALEARPVPATTSPKPTAAVRAEPRTEADLDPAESVTIERWFSLKGTHQKIGQDGTTHRSVGQFLSLAYKQHKIPLDSSGPRGRRSYRVADLRLFIRWWFTTLAEGQEHTHDGWLVHFARHALPAHQATATNDQ